MSAINFHTKEVSVKIVYYGPGLCGKTTSLQTIYRSLPENGRPQLVSLATDVDRTIFFDFLPITAYRIRDFQVRLQLYTVPGQVQYRSTRKLVLKGVDGVIFVADSLAVRREKNMLSLKDLQQNLKEYGINIFKIPLVMQYNKRDLEDLVPLLPIDQMENDLNKQLKVPSFPASAINGEGVGKTLKECLKLTLISLQKEFKWAD